jgi:hypothetical protein
MTRRQYHLFTDGLLFFVLFIIFGLGLVIKDT